MSFCKDQQDDYESFLNPSQKKYTHQKLKHGHTQSAFNKKTKSPTSYQQKYTINQTQRKYKHNPSVLTNYSRQNLKRQNRDLPYFNIHDRVKTQTSSFGQRRQKNYHNEKRKIQNQNEEKSQIFSPVDQLFKLQLQHESLQRNFNLIKKQLEQYKKKAYQKTETYMKLLQHDTQAQLRRFSDIQLLELKNNQIQSQHQSNLLRLKNQYDLENASNKQKIYKLQCELSSRIAQVEALQRKNYEAESKLQRFEKLNNEFQQQKNIYVQSLMSRNKQLQREVQLQKLKIDKIYFQHEELKEGKKQMEGQIHVLLAIQAKKSQEIQINNKKIKQMSENIREIQQKHFKLKCSYEALQQQNNQFQQRLHQKEIEIQFKNGQIQVLKNRELSLIHSQITSREKHEFIIQKKNKQIEEFTKQNQRLYKDLNKLKMSTSQLCIKYNIKEEIIDI